MFVEVRKGLKESQHCFPFPSNIPVSWHVAAECSFPPVQPAALLLGVSEGTDSH